MTHNNNLVTKEHLSNELRRQTMWVTSILVGQTAVIIAAVTLFFG